MLGNVDFEGALGGKRLLASDVGAAKWLLFSVALPAEVGVLMGTHVLCQITGLTEVLPTSWVFAREGAFPRVDSDVLDEIGGLCDGERRGGGGGREGGRGVE